MTKYEKRRRNLINEICYGRDFNNKNKKRLFCNYSLEKLQRLDAYMQCCIEYCLFNSCNEIISDFEQIVF